MTTPLQASPTGAEGSMVEGLFRARPADPALAQTLAKLGVEVTRLQPKYPSLTWAKVLEAVRQSWFPALSPDDGTYQVGLEFARGFQHTIGGKLVLAALPLLSPLTMLMRWPRMVKLGRSDLEFTATQLGPKSVRIDSADPAAVSPWFSVGIIAFMLERLKVTARVRVERHSPTSFSLHYEWD